MFCTKCGAALREGARFCNRCGAPVLRRPEAAKPKAKLTKNGWIALSVVAALLVVLLAVSGGGASGGGKPGGVYASPAYSNPRHGLDSNYYGRGEYVSFQGNKMSVYFVAGAYTMTGKYSIEGGTLRLQVSDSDYELCGGFFNTSGGDIVFNYEKDGKNIILDGIEFYKQ